MEPRNVIAIVLLAGLCAGVGACGKSSSNGLFADRSIPMIAPSASAEAAPSFVGKWAAGAEQCGAPVIIEARSLRDGAVTCDFAKVYTSSAGYAVASTCTAAGGRLQPGRLYIMMSEPDRPTTMTLSGGPFHDPVALQRCAG